jgi:hypothetical protein
MIQVVEALIDRAKPDVSPDAQRFAAAKAVDAYLDAVIDLTRKAFPSSDVCVSLGQDAEDETHQYVALDVDAKGLTSEELLSGKRVWSEGIGRVCAPRYGVYFVLGWR